MFENFRFVSEQQLVCTSLLHKLDTKYKFYSYKKKYLIYRNSMNISISPNSIKMIGFELETETVP